jgi:NAD(P)-dependent dehydrogenase (short-subunit alcohol dehydrogenase family)
LAGLGKAFVEQYLARPNHTVIATVRDVKAKAAEELKALPAGEGSKLVLVKIELASTTDAFDAAKELEAQGITKLDVVIANAGVAGQQGKIETIDVKGLADVYIINAVGPAILFIALKPLLDRAEAPKWLSVSSGLASIHDLHNYPMFPGFPYNGSKAALNHFTKSIHVESDKIVVFAVSPGYVPSPIRQIEAVTMSLLITNGVYLSCIDSLIPTWDASLPSSSASRTPPSPTLTPTLRALSDW